jgi:hypothetical protein
MIPPRLLDLLRSCENTETSHFPPTELFNEGWMLRLVLDAIQKLELDDHPLRFLPQSRWYSEARMASPFAPRSRGDNLGEGFTHADAVIGHFAFDPLKRAGLHLIETARQFVVVEAKMFSNLSTGTTNATEYDQAARNVACMARAVSRSGRHIDDFEQIGFFVLAPELKRRQSRNTNLEGCATAVSIRENISRRIIAYENTSRAEARDLRAWETAYLLPVIEKMDRSHNLRVLSWDDCVSTIAKRDNAIGGELQCFYAKCLEFDRQPPLSSDLNCHQLGARPLPGGLPEHLNHLSEFISNNWVSQP